MNTQICNKIKFMLGGIIPRIVENKDFIKEVTFIFKSGLKEYKGKYDIESGELNFNGKDQNIAVEKLCDVVASEASKYDELHFNVFERGKCISLIADSKNVKILNTEESESLDETKKHQSMTSQLLKRNYFIKVGEADEVLKEIGIITKEGKVRNDMIRKYNQIDHFVELIDGMIDEFSDNESITVMDCGCGKSYLTFVLNYYIKEKKKKNCYFIGIDRSEQVIKASKEIAKRLGYKNMEFIAEDLNTYIPERKIDVVISLHACDTATDMALGLAVRLNAKSIICVPCCHKELLSQYSSTDLGAILKHGVFKARFADMLTDGIRGMLLETKGYRVSIVEYISPLETPKNLLIRAVKVSSENEKALLEYKKVKAMFGIEPTLERLIGLK